jgi:hypothetical protein
MGMLGLIHLLRQLGTLPLTLIRMGQTMGHGLPIITGTSVADLDVLVV